MQEILNYKDEIEAEINHIENLDEYNNKLKKELKVSLMKLFKSFIHSNPFINHLIILIKSYYIFPIMSIIY